MVAEQRLAGIVSDSTPPSSATVRVRWLDPASGRELDTEAALQDIVHDGLIVVRRQGAPLPAPGQVLRLVFQTDNGPFVMHAKTARQLGTNAALVRPMTDARLHERRRWPRVALPPVELHLRHGDRDVVSARVLDLSVRGARFETDLRVASGDQLEFELRWGEKRIGGTAVVIAAVDPGTGVRLCRCRFEGLEPDHESELALLIHDLLPAASPRVARLHLNQVPTTASVLLLGEWVEGDPFEIQVRELGVSLVRFTSKRQVPSGAILRIDLTIDGAPPFVVDAEVRSVEPVSGGWQYDAKLRALSDAARRVIMANIVRFLVTQSHRELT
jgi:hypothetical protein